MGEYVRSSWEWRKRPDIEGFSHYLTPLHKHDHIVEFADLKHGF